MCEIWANSRQHIFHLLTNFVPLFLWKKKSPLWSYTYCPRTIELYFLDAWFLQMDLVTWHESLVYHLFMWFKCAIYFYKGLCKWISLIFWWLYLRIKEMRWLRLLYHASDGQFVRWVKQNISIYAKIFNWYKRRR